MFKQLGTFAILAVCLFALMFASVCPPVAASISGSGKIVYTTNAHGDWDIAVMGPNGRHVEVLTSSTDHEYDPTWSPDGTEVLYVRHQFGNPSVWLMDADGENQRRIWSASQPSWAPDGNRFVAHASGTDALAIFKLNEARDGQSDTNFFDFASDNQAFPAWSPDGKYIAYVAGGNADSPWVGGSLYVYDVAARRSTKIVSGSPGRAMSRPTWGPQSYFIAFAWENAGFHNGNRGLFAVGRDGSRLLILTSWNGYELGHPTVAPYGGEFIVSRYHRSSGRRELYKVTSGTNNWQRIGLTDATVNDGADWWHPSSFSVEPGASQLTTTWGSLKKKAK